VDKALSPSNPFRDPAYNWRAQLLRRILAITLGLELLLLLRNLVFGNNPVFAAVGTAVVLTAQWVARRRRQLGRGWTALLVVAATVVVALAAWFAPASPAPVLCLAILPCTLATLFEGPALGAAASALMLEVLAALAAARPPIDLMGWYRMVNAGLLVVFGFLIAWAIDFSFHRFQSSLLLGGEELQASNEAGQAMAQALFRDLTPLLDDLGAQIGAPGPDLEGAARSASALVQRVAKARELYKARDTWPAFPTEDVRQQVMRSILAIVAGVVSVVVTRNLIWGGSVAGSLGMLCLIPFLLLGLRRWPRILSPARVNASLIAAGFAATSLVFRAWGATADSPSLSMTPVLVMLAGVLNNRAVIIASFAAGLAMLAWAAIGGLPRPDQLQLLTDLGLLQAMLGLVAYNVVQLRQAFLERLRAQAQELSQALRLRRRLAGTLFHDVNNQLAALIPSLDPSFWEDGDPAEALDRATRLCGRIGALVNVSRDFLLGNEFLEDSALKALTVAELFRDMEILFRDRLRAKGQSLVLVGGGGLSVLGLREILTESVLGNLVSNAIKFSPRGSAIEMEANRENDDVTLAVRDCGPGIPQSLVDRLADDGPLPSSLGSDGEAGQGHGLKLVREHLSRQGGRLELSRLAQGGTLAVARLRAAR
jgi:signal transduction histidine kinase